MMRAARKELGLATDETIMIGDTMETDILGGVSMGYRTVLVLSGSTSREDLTRYAYRPDLVLDSIEEMCDERTYREAIGETLLLAARAELEAAI
jgi:NagD protein